ncbi:hypothetical protein BpHYR1_050673 [Brachionus plicatilis]|uniref:Uncharacterized protein n=1 Tax=Brachionus plicatilis TaxID=10195 RepID=A0A3M7SLP8_BRAPC|nr:hypothetical protein BpHYR1_050673 [Brachionus plicatilis]
MAVANDLIRGPEHQKIIHKILQVKKIFVNATRCSIDSCINLLCHDIICSSAAYIKLNKGKIIMNYLVLD